LMSSPFDVFWEGGELLKWICLRDISSIPPANDRNWW
jgi:hypothetical protein